MIDLYIQITGKIDLEIHPLKWQLYYRKAKWEDKEYTGAGTSYSFLIFELTILK
jgi:hypothetical protein